MASSLKYSDNVYTNNNVQTSHIILLFSDSVLEGDRRPPTFFDEESRFLAFSGFVSFYSHFYIHLEQTFRYNTTPAWQRIPISFFRNTPLLFKVFWNFRLNRYGLQVINILFQWVIHVKQCRIGQEQMLFKAAGGKFKVYNAAATT